MTLTLSSPLDPGGPNATTGSLMLLRRRRGCCPASLTGEDGYSSCLRDSALSAALYSSVWSPTQLEGYMNSATRPPHDDTG